MKDLIDYKELQAAARMCIKNDFLSIIGKHQGCGIIGYAIGTDDDVITIGSNACTAMEFKEDEELRFCPPEWSIESWVTAFEPVHSLFLKRRKMEALGSLTFEEIIAQRDKAIYSIRDSLLDLKREGVFGSDIFLTILSTDPSRHMCDLEDEIVESLNSRKIITLRKKAQQG